MSTDPDEEERARQARQAALARLRAADPEAMDQHIEASGEEPDPVAVHLAALQKAYPTRPFLHGGWKPDIQALAGLAELDAEFRPGGKHDQRRRKEKLEAFLRLYIFAPRAVQEQCEVQLFGHAFEPPARRRSFWSRVLFWWR